MGSKVSIQNDQNDSYEIRSYNSFDGVNIKCYSSKILNKNEIWEFGNQYGNYVRFYFKKTKLNTWNWCDVQDSLTVKVSDLEIYQNSSITLKISQNIKEKEVIRLKIKWERVELNEITLKDIIGEGGFSIIYNGIYKNQLIVIKKILVEYVESFKVEKELFE